MIKKKVVTRLVWGLVAIGIISLFFVLRKNTKESEITYTVSKQTVSDELLLAGTIDAQQRVDLGFAVSGRVKKINARSGDFVKKGDIVAEVEQSRLQSELTQAQASYTLARVDTSVDATAVTSNLEKLIVEQDSIVEGLYREYLSGDLQAYNTNKNPREAINPIVSGVYNGDMEGDYYLDIYSSNARSGFSIKVSGLESGTYSGESSQPGQIGEQGLFVQLVEGQSYGNTDWVIPIPNTRSSSYLTRKRAYESALATRSRLINDAQNNINRVTQRDQESQVSRSEAQVNQARAQINAVAGQLSDGKIRAPFDGIIAKNELEIGQIASAFTTQVIMFSDNSKKLNLRTPEIYINKIELGDQVSVTLDAYDDIVFDGKVSFIDFIDTEVGGVPVYKTDIDIQTDDPRIRVGMNAKARIVSKKKDAVIAIPSHYVNKDSEGNSFVMLLIDQNKKEKKYIETGLEGNEGLLEVRTGLDVGDVIVLSTDK